MPNTNEATELIRLLSLNEIAIKDPDWVFGLAMQVRDFDIYQLVDVVRFSIAHCALIISGQDRDNADMLISQELLHEGLMKVLSCLKKSIELSKAEQNND